MPWTEPVWEKYDRNCPRYVSDMTNKEWLLIEPHMSQTRRLGRPRKTDLHEVMNDILYIAASGCTWRLLPKYVPPFSTVQRYFYR